MPVIRVPLDTLTPLEMDRVVCRRGKEPERRYGGVRQFAEDIERGRQFPRVENE
jgi:hypothetical protein